ncbi:MAG: hypothetical protein PVH88_09145 [Ignavibacteria bacterium]|jgi:hypothetical protein
MKDKKDKIYCGACKEEIINDHIVFGEASVFCTSCRSWYHSDCLDIRYEKTDNFFTTMANVGYCPNQKCGKKLG